MRVAGLTSLILKAWNSLVEAATSTKRQRKEYAYMAACGNETTGAYNQS